MRSRPATRQRAGSRRRAAGRRGVGVQAFGIPVARRVSPCATWIVASRHRQAHRGSRLGPRRMPPTSPIWALPSQTAAIGVIRLEHDVWSRPPFVGKLRDARPIVVAQRFSKLFGDRSRVSSSAISPISSSIHASRSWIGSMSTSRRSAKVQLSGLPPTSARQSRVPRRSAPWSLPMTRAAPLRSVPSRKAPLRSAPETSAPRSWALEKVAPWRPAPPKFAPPRSAPDRSAP